MNRLLQDVRHAVRMLLKAPVFTCVVVVTLGVGIGSSTAMFSVVNGVLLRDLPFRDAERVVDLNEVERRNHDSGAVAPATFLDWRRRSTTIEVMSAYRRRTYNVALAAGEPERLEGAMTSSTFFDVLGVSPILGRQFTREDAEPGKGQNVVLSYGLWQRRFGGSPEAINQTMHLNGSRYTVVGVMPATVNFPEGTEFWIPATYDVPADGPGDVRQARDFHYLRGVGRMKAGQTLATVNAELTIISDQIATAYPEESNFTAIARSLHDQLVGASRTPLLILLGAVGCVLLIVVANVANLLMARATVRARELAIRAAVGADRSMLMRQLLTESVLTALVGGALGVLFAFWGVDLILALDPGEVPRVAPIGVNGQVLGFALALSVVTGILFGVVPGWRASQPDLQQTLKDSGRGTLGDGHGHVARTGLVLAEVSLCLVLLVGAGLLFRSLMRLLDVPLGFTTARMLTMQIAPTGENYRSTGQLMAYWDRVLDRARAVPGVESVTLTTALPMGGSFNISAFGVEGKPQVPLNEQPLTHWVDVSPGYFKTMGIPIVRGREFALQDAVENPATIVINEAMARREFLDQDPIGRRFTFGRDDNGKPQWSDIVGVVGNVRQYQADQDPVPMTYGVHTGSVRRPQFVIARTAGDPMTVAASMRSALQSLDAALPISQPRSLDAVVGASLTQRRFNMTLLMIFAGIALLFAMAGIYGTVAYAVAQRTSEIGIRLALGATSSEILRLVLVDALKPVVLGLVVGIVAALGLTRTLARFVYGVSTTDPITFITLSVVLGLVAVVASLLPALRATRVDPLAALRMD